MFLDMFTAFKNSKHVQKHNCLHSQYSPALGIRITELLLDGLNLLSEASIRSTSNTLSFVSRHGWHFVTFEWVSLISWSPLAILTRFDQDLSE